MNTWEEICKIGTICEVDKENRSLAKAMICGRTTDLLPVMQNANSFKRSFSPIRIGEQVLVLSPNGDANGGIILRGIFNTSCKEPTGASDTTEVTEYEDGTIISYDTLSKELKVDSSDKITIICKSATVNADTVSITATTTNTGDVSIIGNLTVTGAIAGSGGLSVSGGTGANVTGNINVSGAISDSKGDLTSHTHSCTDGSTAKAR
jgi:phage baseplate assembly protein V